MSIIFTEDEDIAITESLEQSKKVAINDWSKRTDFAGVKLIGYLCDNGQVIQGDCLTQKKDKILVQFNTNAEHYGKKYDWILIPNERICPPPKNRNTQLVAHEEEFNRKKNSMINEEEFIEQSLVTYEDAVNMLLNINCCFGLYDKKTKQWRTVVFMKKWDNEKRLMIRFTHASDKFLTIKHFPVNYIILNDNKKFNVKERDLKDMSNVPKENIDLWIKEKKERKRQWIEKQKKKECEILVDGYIKDQKKKQYITMIHPGLNKIIAHYCCVLFYGMPLLIIDYNNKKQRREIKWSKRIDFTGVTLIGYLCDDGEVIQGDCLTQKKDKIFVHFNIDAGHFGKKYDWITIPNERICPPPKNRPKQRTIGFAQEMTFHDTSHTYSNNNTNNRHFGSNYVINKEDDDLQRAIAASLTDI